MRLAGARVLVTGASSGIGAATAVELGRRGARVLLAGRDTEALGEVAAQIDHAVWHAEDLATPDGVPRLAAWAESAGGIDVLVCNAGIGWAGKLVEMPDHCVSELVTVNVTATMRLTRALISPIIHNGHGQLVFVSSIAGCIGVADEAVYSGTKGALKLFADALRVELADTGIGVTSVFPGVVKTAFFQRRGQDYDRERPRPIPASTVAIAIARAIERRQAEVFTPSWMRFPARLHGAFPAMVQNLQRRFG